MKRKRTRRRLGATLVEFTLLGIPAIFLFTSVATTSIDLWQFYTLTYATSSTARFASMHGVNCVTACPETRAQLATYFESAAIALSPGSTTFKLTDSSGTTTCNPVTSCSSAVFPASGSNAVGANITISATYTLLNPIFMYWPGGGSGVLARNFTVTTSSTQAIQY